MFFCHSWRFWSNSGTLICRRIFVNGAFLFIAELWIQMSVRKLRNYNIAFLTKTRFCYVWIIWFHCRYLSLWTSRIRCFIELPMGLRHVFNFRFRNLVIRYSYFGGIYQLANLLFLLVTSILSNSFKSLAFMGIFSLFKCLFNLLLFCQLFKCFTLEEKCILVSCKTHVFNFFKSVI